MAFGVRGLMLLSVPACPCSVGFGGKKLGVMERLWCMGGVCDDAVVEKLILKILSLPLLPEGRMITSSDDEAVDCHSSFLASSR